MVSRDPADIVAELEGTCKSLNDVLTDEEQYDQGLLDALDMVIFECETCGWWCEINEMSEEHEWTCKDCNDD